MLTGEIRSQIDAVWNAFWTGGISNPLEVIEQPDDVICDPACGTAGFLVTAGE